MLIINRKLLFYNFLKNTKTQKKRLQVCHQIYKNHIKLFPITKVLFVVLLVSVIFNRKLFYYFSIYLSVLLIAVAVFQNMGNTETYGFSVLIGNLILQLIVVTFWIVELIVRKNIFQHEHVPLWR